MVTKEKRMGLVHFWEGCIKSVSLVVFNLVLSGILASAAYAINIDMPGDANLDIKTTLNYGFSMRLVDPDSALLSNINGDDGNRNFDKGKLTSNRGSISTEVAYIIKNLTFYTNLYGFYDLVYNADNENDSPSTNNNFVGGRIAENDEFDGDTRQIHGRSGDLRDLYVSGDFRIADRSLMVRVGKQVISWGESLATFGSISSAMSYADATKINVPGYELRDVFLPTGAGYFQVALVDDLSLSGYYQWEWEKNILDAAGSFFSTSDLIDKGGHYYLGAPNMVAFTRIADEEPSNGGQWGASLRYRAQNFYDTEFALCYINYHEKFPLLKINPAAGGYYTVYPEDVGLIGASFGTTIGDTNYGGEIAYRMDLPVQVKAGLPTYEEVDLVQVLLNVYHVFGPMSFIDNTIVLFEGGFNSVLEAENLSKDTDACGYLIKTTFQFFRVLPRVDLEVPVTFKHKVKGKSALTGTWTEREHELAMGLDFTYDLNLKFSLSYTNFLGDAQDYAKSDRDYVSAYIKYTF
ncbi:MAG: DUF1302 family protein [Desulfobacterales bacterium]|jgi:hypothetical protein|nr:DUF1302 family protein [Desulfobacterales bacterium]